LKEWFSSSAGDDDEDENLDDIPSAGDQDAEDVGIQEKDEEQQEEHNSENQEGEEGEWSETGWRGGGAAGGTHQDPEDLLRFANSMGVGGDVTEGRRGGGEGAGAVGANSSAYSSSFQPASPPSKKGREGYHQFSFAGGAHRRVVGADSSAYSSSYQPASPPSKMGREGHHQPQFSFTELLSQSPRTAFGGSSAATAAGGTIRHTASAAASGASSVAAGGGQAGVGRGNSSSSNSAARVGGRVGGGHQGERTQHNVGKNDYCAGNVRAGSQAYKSTSSRGERLLNQATASLVSQKAC